MRFKGRYKQNLDAKGRLSVPAPIREQLEKVSADSLVITCTDRCLEIFPESEWEKLVRKFERLPQMREDVELFQLFYISQAIDAAPDKNGRILVPRTMREQIGLEKQIVIVGHTSKVQVYAAEVWKQVEEEGRKRFSEIRNLLSEDLS
jgi:MraZ protein